MFLLDTNIISYISKNNSQVIAKLQATDTDKINTCSLVIAELFFGAMNHPDKARGKILLQYYVKLSKETQIYDFDTESGLIFSQIKLALKEKGLIIDDFDLLIASIALANNLTLVTNNTKHFKNIQGLNLEDWTK
jgi:tRNA(fMet)-specific endonuclease VapC